MDNSEKPAEIQIEEKVENSETEDFSISSVTKKALKDLPEVLSFIQRLQECIFRQRVLIHKLYQKLKEESSTNKSTKDASTQTNEADFTNEIYSEESSGNLVEDIKKAAESAVHQTGLVYEETSGMYYDYKTGYYYSAELGLYYDGHNGIYYYFDESSKSYQFHSQISVQPPPSTDTNGSIIVNECDKKRKNDGEDDFEKIPKKPKPEFKEDGECSESSSEIDSESIEAEIISSVEVPTCDSNKDINDVEDCNTKPNIVQNNDVDDEVANAWPPCLRIVVKETGLDNLVVGSLFIVTCTGGTLGRQGDHAVLIPDINISKHHAKISYNEEDQCYQIVDLGSRNGTFVDSQRISAALQESDPVALSHGSMIRLGATHLECHVHLGRETCTDCEPGCAQSKHAAILEQTIKDHETKEARHRSELRRLRKRFGLDKLTIKENTVALPPGYQDRAEERRKTVGSQDHHAKTETASVHQSIQGSNKGFQMLSKMGWSKGQSLGKDSTKGITEPVLVEQRPDKVGLGSDAVHLPIPDVKAKKKTEIWKKAQQRFQELDDKD